MIGKKTKEDDFVIHENYMKFKFQYPQALLEHSLTHLFIACGCFQATTAELNSCDRDSRKDRNLHL